MNNLRKMEIWKLVEERKNYLRVFEEKSANCHKKRKSLTLGRDRWHLCSWSSDQRQGQAPTLKPSEKPGSFTLLRLHFFTLHLAQTVLCRISTFLTANALRLAFQTLPRLCYSSSCSHCLPFGLFTLFRTLLWLQIKLIRKNLNFFFALSNSHYCISFTHTYCTDEISIFRCDSDKISLAIIIYVLKMHFLK